MKPNGCRIRTQETASARNRNGAAQRRLVVGDPVATASTRRGSHHVSGAPPFAVPAPRRPSTVRRRSALTEKPIQEAPGGHLPAAVSRAPLVKLPESAARHRGAI